MGNEDFTGLSDSPTDRKERKQIFRRQRMAALYQQVRLFAAVCMGSGIGALVGAFACGKSELAGRAFGWAMIGGFVGGFVGLLRGVYVATWGAVWENLGDHDNADQGTILYLWTLIGGTLGGGAGAWFAVPETWIYAVGGGILLGMVAWSAHRVVRRSRTGGGPKRFRG